MIETSGVIEKEQGNGFYLVTLEQPAGHQCLCRAAGKLTKFRIKLLAGDKVVVEISPYDLSGGGSPIGNGTWARGAPPRWQPTRRAEKALRHDFTALWPGSYRWPESQRIENLPSGPTQLSGLQTSTGSRASMACLNVARFFTPRHCCFSSLFRKR